MTGNEYVAKIDSLLDSVMVDEALTEAIKAAVLDHTASKARMNKAMMPREWGCVLCGREEPGDPNLNGHNPAPLADDGRCCSVCNDTRVIPARLERMFSK